MPSRDEVVAWCNEMADWFDSLAKMTDLPCANELNSNRAKMWRDRAVAVDAMVYGTM